MKKGFFTLLLIYSISSLSAQKGLQLQDKAPAFAGEDQKRQKISLEKELANGPVVLVFYRGQWCPYCNRFLKKLEDSISYIRQKGAALIAVTAEKTENIAKTVGKTKASFPILFDDGLTIMKKYDVAFAVDPKTIEKYKGYGIDFTEANGSSNGNNLPVPAVYVINKNGVIVYRFFESDYTKRPGVKEILDKL